MLIKYLNIDNFNYDILNYIPEKQSVGGILFDFVGNIVDSFSWGLGKKTNNEAEWLTFMLGFEITARKGISKIIIIGDSKKVIQKMKFGYKKGNIRYNRYIERSLLSPPNQRSFPSMFFEATIRMLTFLQTKKSCWS